MKFFQQIELVKLQPMWNANFNSAGFLKCEKQLQRKLFAAKRFLDVAKPTKHKQTNNRTNFFDPVYLPIEKNWSWSDSSTGLLSSQAY